jgi:2',3'-cyclic-nucleotide 2'-phosphodiesterase (5'-nucleotidase family)
MDIAATSCHGAIRLVENLRDHSPEFRAEIHKLHEPAAAVLRRAVEDLLAGTGRDAELVAAMLSSLLNAAAAKMMESGGRDEVLAELRRSVHCILNAGKGDAASVPV